jgi:hypothetical protein
VHLLVEWSLADPFFRLIDQMKRNPSFGLPRVAKYCESGLNARLQTPNVCSLRMERGTSGKASRAVENIRTRGLYPVSPTARKRPLGLMETLVTALILSLDDQARGLPLSAASLDGDPLGTFRCGFERMCERDRDRGSGVAGGVD